MSGPKASTTVGSLVTQPSEGRVVVFGDPEPCYVATLTLVRRRAEGPPPSTGEGVHLTPPHALKLMIDLTAALWLSCIVWFPHPFQGWGIIIAYFDYWLYSYIDFVLVLFIPICVFIICCIIK